MTNDEFEALLRFLVSGGPAASAGSAHPYDRDEAGAKYEHARRILIKMFINRGSHRPEELADKTLDRTAKKVMEMKEPYDGLPEKYIVSIAKYIWLEELDRLKKEPESPPSNESLAEVKSQCLLKCMMKELSKSERLKITEYYRHDGKLKSEHRSRIAKLYKMTKGALANEIFRIKERLTPCVTDCCEERENNWIN